VIKRQRDRLLGWARGRWPVCAGILFRSWRRRRTRPPLVGAGRVLELGAAAVVLALLGVPYRLVVGPAFIAAILAVLVSGRTEHSAP